MVVGYGISGANLAAPFDSNPSLPQVNSGSGSGQMALTVSTSSANDMLLGVMSNTGGQGIAPPSSFKGILQWHRAMGLQGLFLWHPVLPVDKLRGDMG